MKPYKPMLIGTAMLPVLLAMPLNQLETIILTGVAFAATYGLARLVWPAWRVRLPFVALMLTVAVQTGVQASEILRNDTSAFGQLVSFVLALFVSAAVLLFYGRTIGSPQKRARD